jgi:hypothetical protein
MPRPSGELLSYLDLMRAFSFGIILVIALIAAVGGGVAFSKRRSSIDH